ncbi:hypothetical protein JCM11641_008188 [Rhodosporidiobolus odoratus]
MSSPQPSPEAASTDLPNPIELLDLDIDATALLDTSQSPPPTDDTASPDWESRLKRDCVNSAEAARWGPVLDSVDPAWKAWYESMKEEGRVAFDKIMTEFHLRCERLQADYDAEGKGEKLMICSLPFVTLFFTSLFITLTPPSSHSVLGTPCCRKPCALLEGRLKLGNPGPIYNFGAQNHTFLDAILTTFHASITSLTRSISPSHDRDRSIRPRSLNVHFVYSTPLPPPLVQSLLFEPPHPSVGLYGMGNNLALSCCLALDRCGTELCAFLDRPPPADSDAFFTRQAWAARRRASWAGSDANGGKAFGMMVTELWAQEKCEHAVKEREGVDGWDGFDQAELARRAGPIEAQQISNLAARWDDNSAVYLPHWLEYYSGHHPPPSSLLDKAVAYNIVARRRTLDNAVPLPSDCSSLFGISSSRTGTPLTLPAIRDNLQAGLGRNRGLFYSGSQRRPPARVLAAPGAGCLGSG